MTGRLPQHPLLRQRYFAGRMTLLTDHLVASTNARASAVDRLLNDVDQYVPPILDTVGGESYT